MFWARNDQLHRHYIRNLSSVTAAWYISQKWAVQGMFTYTPTIPSLGALTDYMQQTSPYLWNNGNPNLKVAENFTYSLAAQYVHRKFSAVLISDISDVKNSTFSDITYLGDGKFLSQTVNAKRHFAWKNSLQLSLTNIHGFGANVQLALSRYEKRNRPMGLPSDII